MKLGRIAAFGLSMFSASVFAESGVTLYGLIDTGVEYVSHANAVGNGVFRMPGVSGELPSRWGLRGSERSWRCVQGDLHIGERF